MSGHVTYIPANYIAYNSGLYRYLFVNNAPFYLCGGYDRSVCGLPDTQSTVATITPHGSNVLADPSYIEASLVIVQFSDLVELWHVDTQNLEYLQSLVTNVMDQFSDNRLWVGVSMNLDAETFEETVQIFADAGFGQPTISTQSPHGVAFASYILNLWYDPSAMLQDNVVAEAMKLHTAFQKLLAECTTHLFISRSILDQMYDFLTLDHERGGVLQIASYNKKREAQLQLTRLTRQEKPGVYEVAVPVSRINFHTHPNICYVKYGCHIGWPSGQDMAYIASNYPKVMKHYVFTREGVYAVQLDPTFMQLLTFLRNQEAQACLSDLFNIIMFRFTSEEYKRAYNIVDPDDDNLYNEEQLLTMSQSKFEGAKQEYLRTVNTYSFENLLNDYALASIKKSVRPACLRDFEHGGNFLLFRNRLVEWPDMTEGLHDTVEIPGLSCPLPVEN